jgi:two-component sensor histidine kinase
MAAREPPHADAALRLSMAVIDSSNAPLLLLDEHLNVLAASASFGRAFEVDADALASHPIFEIGAGEWNVPQLRSLLLATASGRAEIDAYEMDLKRPGRDVRMLVLHAQKLSYGEDDPARVLLTVADVTDARLADKVKDNLLREKAILLQEVQHRVANSLQIIASVLLLNARKVQSEETRTHLHDAHERVMSVAALQKQLAISTLGNVALGPYFTQLCDSIGASMIRDHDQLSLAVTVDDSVASGDMSVCLGLIVTELVINALKHAFPGHRHGTIAVDYHAHGPNWTLSVSDDGVGMSQTDPGAKAGLGTTIVEALARQLKARVQVADAHPGTLVSIIHAQLVAVDAEVLDEQAV